MEDPALLHVYDVQLMKQVFRCLLHIHFLVAIHA